MATTDTGRKVIADTVLPKTTVGTNPSPLAENILGKAGGITSDISMRNRAALAAQRQASIAQRQALAQRSARQSVIPPAAAVAPLPDTTPAVAPAAIQPSPAVAPQMPDALAVVRRRDVPRGLGVAIG